MLTLRVQNPTRNGCSFHHPVADDGPPTDPDPPKSPKAPHFQACRSCSFPIPYRGLRRRRIAGMTHSVSVPSRPARWFKVFHEAAGLWHLACPLNVWLRRRVIVPRDTTKTSFDFVTLRGLDRFTQLPTSARSKCRQRNTPRQLTKQWSRSLHQPQRALPRAVLFARLWLRNYELRISGMRRIVSRSESHQAAGARRP